MFSTIGALKSFAILWTKKSLKHRCFPVNITKFLRTAFLQNLSGSCFSIFLKVIKQLFRKGVNVNRFLKKCTCYDGSFIKRQTSGTSSDNECCNESQRITTNGNEWQRVVQRVTTSDNEWQRVIMNENEWQRMKTCGITNDSATRMLLKVNDSDFRFQNETIMQCITTIYSATSFWKYNIKKKICRSSHRRSSIKKAALKNFAIFTGKHLKACNFIKKRFQRKCCEYCEIFKNTCFEEHLWTAASGSVFNKNKRCLRGSKNLHKIGFKNWWIGEVPFK